MSAPPSSWINYYPPFGGKGLFICLGIRKGYCPTFGIPHSPAPGVVKIGPAGAVARLRACVKSEKIKIFTVNLELPIDKYGKS
nr:MAG TPA: hypothetical protein [Bacteriophage sp.]